VRFIARTRHINGYGLLNPRLDRLQRFEVSDEQRTKPEWITTCKEALLFFIPLNIHSRLLTLFNGRVVYHRHWDVFFNDMRGTWLLMGFIALCLSIGDVILLSQHATSIFGHLSLVLSCVTLFLAIYLHQKHSPHLLSTGPDISTYVMQHERYRGGLRPLAILLSLPQALVIYSGATLYVSVLLLLVQSSQATTVGPHMLHDLRGEL